VRHEDTGGPSALGTFVGRGKDLPEELFLFISRVTPLINVDLLIKDEHDRTLLTWRDDEHYGCGWHVPGGIIRFKEHAQERIQKVAELELGCSITAEPVPLMIIEAFVESRERGHFISLLYRCRLATQPARLLQAGNIPQRGQWRWHNGPPHDLLAVHRMYIQVL
jgi:colanic acid biosynthesis protein WcaH